MNRIIRFMLFFTVFFTIYLSLNAYIIFRLGGMFRIPVRILRALVILAVISLPLALFIENRLPNIISKIWYIISTLWMGVGLFMLCSLVVFEIVNVITKVDPRKAGIVILVVVVVLSVYSIINASFISVKEIKVPVEDLKQEVKIVQLSDLHVGTIRNSGFLKKITDQVNEIDPDIVMITGDLVDGTAPLHTSMFSGFDKLRAPVYFVTGNHETYEGVSKVYDLLNDTKITVLKNEAVTWDGIQVVGVEFSEDRQNLARQLSKININQSKPAVLMYHPPINMEDAKKAGIDLQLSGHTHDGQIYPFNFFVWLVFRHVNGLYDLDGMKLYVSPGTGTWGPYMRLGSRNEITVLNLIKEVKA